MGSFILYTEFFIEPLLINQFTIKQTNCMLDKSLLDQVRQLFADLKSNYTFRILIPNSHPSNTEMVELLEDVASCSSNIKCEVIKDTDFRLYLLKDGEETSICFRAVPNGHEFSTLLLAILNMEGKGKNLPDEALVKRIQALRGNVTVRTYISLSCTNCPDVVQALNVVSILNPSIKHEIVDGAINREEAEKYNIQAVPAVFINDKMIHVGKSSLGEIVDKLVIELGVDSTSIEIDTKAYDVIVVGGGPSGVSAAIYSARKGLNVAIVANKIGGQVLETVDIENVISVPKTTGALLAQNLKLHANDYSIDLLENRSVTAFDIIDGVKQIHTSLNEILTAPAVIISTGASWRKLNIPGESQYIGSGVAFCTHCDGPFYKGKRVAVIGGGNSGLEAAIDLAAIAKEVYIIEYMSEFKGDQVLQRKLEALSNVTILKNTQSIEVLGDGKKVSGLIIKDRNTEIMETLDLDGVFVQIGLQANSEIFKDKVSVNRMGEIEIDTHCRTNLPGVYAAGDVSTVPFKQIIIAMGEGAKAALTAFEDKLKDQLL